MNTNNGAIIKNYGGVTHPEEITKYVLQFNWLFRKVFGELHDDIVYDEEVEFSKRMLKQVYLFKDIDLIFPRKLHRARFYNTLETLFRYIRATDTPTKE